MTRFLRYALLLFLLAGSALSAGAQTKKEDLQKQRDKLNEQISLTKKLIREAETKQKLTAGQLAVLQEQIRYREALIATISLEIRTIDREIQSREATVNRLKEDLEHMRREYAMMITSAYKNRSGYDKLMYVFASDNFNQAYKRFKITQRYAEKRKQQVAAMERTQAQLSEAIRALQKDRESKQVLASAKEKEKTSINQDRKQQEVRLNSLKLEEKQLREQQKKQEADRKKLTARIEEIIRAEIEAERKKAAAAGATPTSSGKFELAPEVKLMNADFEKNKGALPWPVGSGVVGSRFGRQPHSSLAGIEIDNKGIDFITEKDGRVKSVFNGVVTSVFTIPGAGQNIIVTHGSYKTVYSGMNEVFVKVGDDVSAQEVIGTVLFNGEDSILHFEVWKVTAVSGAAQNPELWIKRR